MDDLYLDTILDLYKHPQHRGWIDAHEGEDVLVRKSHNPSCGDAFEVAMRLADGRIVEAKWRGEGCAISTVAIDQFCGWAIGKDSSQLSDLSRSELMTLVGLETITPAREKCLYLPLSVSADV